jgi:lipoprotein signal peptidase
MKKRAWLLIYLLIGLFFLLFDQFLKWQSLHNWSEKYLLNKFLGWQPFLNPGVAFGLPLPNIWQILFGLIIISIISYILFKLLNDDKNYSLLTTHSLRQYKVWIQTLRQGSLILILAGAVSNLIDRIVYHHTVDYFLILTGIINLADVMIVGGFILFFLLNFELKDSLIDLG